MSREEATPCPAPIYRIEANEAQVIINYPNGNCVDLFALIYADTNKIRFNTNQQGIKAIRELILSQPPRDTIEIAPHGSPDGTIMWHISLTPKDFYEIFLLKRVQVN